MTKYVIVGAGVIGLYTAFELLQQGINGKEISIIGEYLPGDESTLYPSMAAGANHSLMSGEDDNMLRFEQYNYENIHKIQSAIGGKSMGLDRYKSTEYWESKPISMKKIDSVKSYFDQYHEIPKEELPKGVEFGISFLSWNFNAPKFLINFQNYLINQGINFHRLKLTHLIQAFNDDTKVVFNCSGMGAKQLAKDDLVYPARGQVVVIKAPHIFENVMYWRNDNKPPTYIIKRPYSNDQLILGGFYQKDNYSSDNFKIQNDDILKRTTNLFPKILNGKSIDDLEILKNVTGLRPGRFGGVRIEKERFDEGKIVVHNYGAGGYGYQAGFGMAHEAVQLALNNNKL